jgi:hypothetical protein
MLKLKVGSLPCVFLLLLAGCSANAALYAGQSARVTRQSGGIVAFTSATTYTYALRTITDLGLQTTNFCMFAIVNSKGKVVGGLPWTPLDNKTYFVTLHGVDVGGIIGGTPTVVDTTTLPTLTVMTTSLAPADWVARLEARPGVAGVDTNAVGSCPNIGQPDPGTVTSLPLKQTGTYIRVLFSSHIPTYDSALYLVSNLGLRLADPCYEVERDQPNDWHPMGQETQFFKSHSLVVATTPVSPADWQTMLPHIPGVASIAAPLHLDC